MAVYDLIIEYINPCDGGNQSDKEFLEDVEVDDFEAYAEENSMYDIMEVDTTADGDTVVTTGDGNGYVTRFIFCE
ncbi:hypothetical protein P261_01866 [Lachnospiraceae bacterium TWA4]|nr:hypothetical protein P261_01866 [Lachnospiraceae bacterium TWA4]